MSNEIINIVFFLKMAPQFFQIIRISLLINNSLNYLFDLFKLPYLSNWIYHSRLFIRLYLLQRHDLLPIIIIKYPFLLFISIHNFTLSLSHFTLSLSYFILSLSHFTLSLSHFIFLWNIINRPQFLVTLIVLFINAFKFTVLTFNVAHETIPLLCEVVFGFLFRQEMIIILFFDLVEIDFGDQLIFINSIEIEIIGLQFSDLISIDLLRNPF